MCASVLMIVALTCERHFAITSPHRVRFMNGFLQIYGNRCHLYRPTSCCSLFLFFWGPMGSSGLSNFLSCFQYRIYVRTTRWWKHLAFYVVPVTLLSFFFNIPMFLNLKVIQQSRQKNLKRFLGLKVKWMCVLQNSLFHLTSRTMIQTEGKRK